ncbi:MAG: hypothetical protein KGL43_21995 [Burkholderiales bacterium]|nr:hypothetical protein [Burkholderiales bacterium]MDE2393870.1 hypothetical protein [Burkholderiales bacterium]MDE2456269.1 hypothetical protein [Burkholderiales bacterium]
MLWVEVNPRADHVVNVRVLAPVADVVDALHDGARVVGLFAPGQGAVSRGDFQLVGHEDGRESIGFDAQALQGCGLLDMVELDAAMPSAGRGRI